MALTLNEVLAQDKKHANLILNPLSPKRNASIVGVSPEIPTPLPSQEQPTQPSPTAADYGKILGASTIETVAGVPSNVLNVATGGYSDELARQISGKGLTQQVADTVGDIRESVSPGMKAAQAKKFINTDGGELSLGDAWTDPNSLASQFVNSVPAMAATMVPALRAGKLAGAEAAAGGATAEAVTQAAERAGMVSGMKANAVIAGSLQGQEAAGKINAMSEEQLMGSSPGYNTLREQGLTHEQAQADIANKASAVTSVIGGTGSSLAGAYFDKFLGKLGAGEAGNGLEAGAKGLALNVPGEMAQEGVEQTSTNLGVKTTANENQALTEDVANSMAAGGVMGGVQGGATGLVLGDGGNRDQQTTNSFDPVLNNDLVQRAREQTAQQNGFEMQGAIQSNQVRNWGNLTQEQRDELTKKAREKTFLDNGITGATNDGKQDGEATAGAGLPAESNVPSGRTSGMGASGTNGPEDNTKNDRQQFVDNSGSSDVSLTDNNNDQETKTNPDTDLPQDSGNASAPIPTDESPKDESVNVPASVDSAAELVTRKDGPPFKTEAIAKAQLSIKGLSKTHSIAPVDGGFAIKPNSTNENANTTDSSVDNTMQPGVSTAEPDTVIEQPSISTEGTGDGEVTEPVSFVATHELNDGTPVRQIEGNTFIDADNEEWQSDDATPIDQETKNVYAQVTAKPKQETIETTNSPVTLSADSENHVTQTGKTGNEVLPEKTQANVYDKDKIKPNNVATPVFTRNDGENNDTDKIVGLRYRPSDNKPFETEAKAKQALKNNRQLKDDEHDIVSVSGGYAIAPTRALSFDQYKSLPRNKSFSDDLLAQSYEAETGNKPELTAIDNGVTNEKQTKATNSGTGKKGTRSAAGNVYSGQAASNIESAAHEAATSKLNDLPEPTQAQKEAGNYKKGHVSLHGLDITVENPRGSDRSGTDKDGKPWSVKMKHHYGYIKRSTGADNEQVDVFIGDNPESTKAFVVNQIHPHNGKFDEHKVMLGFNSEKEALKGYNKNYAKGWKGAKSIVEMPVSELKDKISSGVLDKPVKQQANTQATETKLQPDNSESELNKKISEANKTLPTGFEIKVDGGSLSLHRNGKLIDWGFSLVNGIGELERQAKNLDAKDKPVVNQELTPESWWTNASPAERRDMLISIGRADISDTFAKIPWRDLSDNKRAQISNELGLKQPAPKKKPVTPQVVPDKKAEPVKQQSSNDEAEALAELKKNLAEVENTLLNQGRVQDARLRKTADDYRAAIAEIEHPEIFLALNRNAGATNRVARDISFKPEAQSIKDTAYRALKDHGWTNEYAEQYSKRVAEALGEDSIKNNDDIYEKSADKLIIELVSDSENEYIVRSAPAQVGSQSVGSTIFARFAINNSGKAVKIRYFHDASANKEPARIAIDRWVSANKETNKGNIGETEKPIDQDAERLLEIYNESGKQAANDAFREIASSKNLRVWESDALANKFKALIKAQEDENNAPVRQPIPSPVTDQASAGETKAGKEENKAETQYGKSNKVFTEDAASKARERLKAKLGRLNSGFDPEMMLDGMVLAGYHIEAGAVKFADYSKAMIADIGEGVKPYLVHFYNSVRDYPGFDNRGMATYSELQISARMGVYQGEMWSFRGESPREVQSINESYVTFTTADNSGKTQVSVPNFFQQKKEWARIDENQIQDNDNGNANNTDNENGTGEVQGLGTSGTEKVRRGRKGNMAGDGKITTPKGNESVLEGEQAEDVQASGGDGFGGPTNASPGMPDVGTPTNEPTGGNAMAGQQGPSGTGLVTDGAGERGQPGGKRLEKVRAVQSKFNKDRFELSGEFNPTIYVAADEKQYANSPRQNFASVEEAKEWANKNGYEFVSDKEEKAAKKDKSLVDGDTKTKLSNYHITDPEALIGGSPKVRFARNKKAIETYQNILDENREPTAEERDAMAAYIGWGSFGQDLFQGSWEKNFKREGWEEENAWLREHLGESAWKSAQASIINAHYTDPPTVKALWDIAKKLGFNGGRVLEPAMGIGNFFGLMPIDLMERSDLTGIELDETTGGMAKMLYPDANIQVKGYQDSKTADDFYDLVIGNWPFAAQSPSDLRYNKLNLALHDYFFVKALDQVRPGGLVIGITSAGTMDKVGKIARSEMHKKGTVVAAFRMPMGAFDKYAGTSVVADIIIMQKRGEGVAEITGESWKESGPMTKNGEPVTRKDGSKVNVNAYWSINPDNVLGNMTVGRGTTTFRDGMIVERQSDYPEVLAKLADRLPQDIMTKRELGKTISYITNNTKDRQNSVVTGDDGKLYVVQGDRLALLSDIHKYAVKSEKETESREQEIKDIVGIRKTYGELLDAERSGAENTEDLRKSLNAQYKAFVKSYGNVSKSKSLAILKKVQDPFYPAIAALENNTGTKAKPVYTTATILTRPTMRGKVALENPSVTDAFILVRNDSADFIDINRIAELSKTPVADVEKELLESGALYKTPAGNHEVSDIYLSGNVRRKLREALEAQESGQDMTRNIEALKKVLPKDTPYFSIEASMGANWIGAEHYRQFIADLLGVTGAEISDIKPVLMPKGWKVEMEGWLNKKPEAQTIWGVPFYPFSKIVNSAFSGASITIKAKDEDGNEYVDAEATKAANEKVDKLREEFKNWIWKDSERRVSLEKAFNETMNAFSSPNYDGSFMKFEGMALQRGDNEFSLREHQVNAIWRGVANGRGLYAHEVGTGKSHTIAGIAIESRRYGITKKPLVFAHNANSSSLASDIQSMYPGAKVLYIDNLSPKEIKQRLYQIANDDWDAVVVPHSLIDRFSLTKETMMAIAERDISALEEESIASAKEEGFDISDMLDDEEALRKVRGASTAKELVKQRNAIIEKINKMADRASREDAIFFEQLGVDMLIVDEVHSFKKSPLTTRMSVKGLNKSASGEGIAMHLLTTYVRNLNGGKGVHSFTGTPITNTLNEIYNQMRYVMGDAMDDAGVAEWDSWFNTFAGVVSDVELTATGEYEAVSKLTGFYNVAELRKFAGQYMDIVFADEMPEFVSRTSKSGKTLHDADITDAERNELVNGRTENPEGRPYKKVINETIQMSDTQKGILRELVSLSRYFKNAEKKLRRKLKQHISNPVLVDTAAAKASFDARLYDIDAPDYHDSKINRVVANVIKHYNEHDKASQVIFMDKGYNDTAERSMRKDDGFTMLDSDGKSIKETVPTFNAAKDIVKKLVEQGIPAEQIAVVTGSTSKEKRKQIADDMNTGKIRVVIGGTQTLGVGVNMQENLRAMHHMDAPWMPGELEQRNGRGHRQGNKWNTVLEYRYLTEGIDGRRWQVLAIKQKFITAFLKADEDTRVIEGDAVDMSDSEGIDDISESLSAAAGDPRLLMREKLKADVNKLENKQRTHDFGIADAKETAHKLKRRIELTQQRIDKGSDDAAHVLARKDKPFSIEINGKTYTERKDVNDALAKAYDKANIGDMIGSINGFEIYARRDNLLKLARQDEYEASPSIASIEANLRNISKHVEKDRQIITESEQSIERMNQAAKTPFGQATALEKKKAMLEQIMKDLELYPAPAPAWLREGAPVGTDVYLAGGKKVTVQGHRWGNDNWFVLIDDGQPEATPLPYTEIMDENNMPVYEAIQFQQPVTASVSAESNVENYSTPVTKAETAPNGVTEDSTVVGPDRNTARVIRAIPPVDGIRERLSDWQYEVEHEGGDIDIVSAADYLPESKPDNDFKFSKNKAYISDDQWRREISNAAYSTDDSTRAVIVSMSPDDFLSMASDSYGDSLRRAKEYGDFDADMFTSDWLPTLDISKSGKVEGHEGRARSEIARLSGVTEIPVILRLPKSNRIKSVDESPKIIFAQDSNKFIRINDPVLVYYGVNNPFGNESLFSKQPPKTGSTIDQVKSWLPKRVKPMLDAGKLVVLQKASDVIGNVQSIDADGVEGFYNEKTDVLYLIADGIAKDNINSVLNHELFHRLEATDAKLKEAIAKFDKDLQHRFNMASIGIGSKIEKEAYKRVMDAETPVKDLLSEFKAYLITEYSKSPDTFTGEIKRIIEQFIASIRAAMLKAGVELSQLTPADLTALAKYGARVDKSKFSTDAMRFSKSLSAKNDNNGPDDTPPGGGNGGVPSGNNTVAGANDNGGSGSMFNRAQAHINGLVGKMDTWGPLGSLPFKKEYLTGRYRTLGNLAKVEEISRSVYDTFAKSSKDDAAAIYRYLTTKDATIDEIHNVMLRKAAKDVKRAIMEVGQQLVDRGFLDQETHDKYEGMYLPRVYLKHILGDELFSALGSGKSASDLGYLKQRKDIPEEVRRLILMEIKDPAYLAGRALNIPMRDIAIFDWFDQVANNKSWVWDQSFITMSITPDGQPEYLITPDGDGTSLIDINNPLSADTIQTKTDKRKKNRVYEPIRLKPGAITRKVTPYYLSKEAERMRKQAFAAPEQDHADILALADLYEDAANRAIKIMATASEPKDFIQMPKSARYGALAGLVVRKEIHDDIVGTMTMFQGDPSVAQKILGDGGALSRYTSFWKFMKVAANPPSHVRNVISNLVLLHLSGVPFHQVPNRVFQAIDEIRNGGKHWDVAKQYGVTQATFANTELFRMNRELNDLIARNQDANSWERLKALTHLNFGKGVDRLGDWYQFMEAVGKVAKIIDDMEKGVKPEDAAINAHEALFDYSLVSNSVRYLRNAPLGTPFASFYVKALPQLVKVATTHPERFLPYILTFKALGLMVAAQNDVDDDDLDKLKKALPEWLQEKGHAYILPVKDSLGRWQAVDLGYFVPWTMYTELLGEAARGDIGGALRSIGVLGSPVADLITAVKTGIDPFTRKPIIDKFGTPAEQMGDIFNYLWRMNMPTFITDIGASGKLIEALSGDVDKQGNQKTTTGQALLRFVGVNIYGLDPENERAKNIRRKRFEMIEARTEWRKSVRDQNADEAAKEKASEHYRELIANMADDLQEYIKESEIHPNLKLDK